MSRQAAPVKEQPLYTGRYYIYEASKSGHCCFEYTVIDSFTGETMCECFELEPTELICNSLNEAHERNEN